MLKRKWRMEEKEEEEEVTSEAKRAREKVIKLVLTYVFKKC